MHLCIILNVSLFSSCQLFCPGQFGDVVWRHMNPEQPVQRDRLCLNILNNQLFLVLCFDVLMFCLFVLFFILVLFICSIFSHLHIIMYDREIIFIFCYFVDVNFHHNVWAFFHLKFGILEFLISKVYLYCLFMLLHSICSLCPSGALCVSLWIWACTAWRSGHQRWWWWAMGSKRTMAMECLRPNVHFIILIFCNLFINS